MSQKYHESCVGCVAITCDRYDDTYDTYDTYCYIANSIEQKIIDDCPCWNCLVKVVCSGEDCKQYKDLNHSCWDYINRKYYKKPRG